MIILLDIHFHLRIDRLYDNVNTLGVSCSQWTSSLLIDSWTLSLLTVKVSGRTTSSSFTVTSGAIVDWTVNPLRANYCHTAWDSEIESVTSLDASLIQLDRRKTRRRHRVTAALDPSKSCLLPCNANLHASSASLKHGLPSPSFSNDLAFWITGGSSWSLMRSLKSGARKKPWRVGSSQPGKDRKHSCSRFPFLSFSLCCGSFFEDRSARNGCCWAWRQRTRGVELRGVINTLLGAGVESTRELRERFRVVQGDNPFLESMSHRIESVIDAAGSWPKY